MGRKEKRGKNRDRGGTGWKSETLDKQRPWDTKKAIYIYISDTYMYIIYVRMYILYICVCLCMYILLNGVNAYLTFGTGFSFFYFPPPFYIVCFFVYHSSRYRFFGDTLSTRSTRYDSSVHTRTHAMLFMCIRDRLFRTTDAGDKREIEKRQLYR